MRQMQLFSPSLAPDWQSADMKVIVYHAGYGCDTGCCGHIVAMDENPDEYGGNEHEKFEFDHPYDESDLEFAKRLVRETFGEKHVADLDWDNCIIRDF
jgi:hypothetical protein